MTITFSKEEASLVIHACKELAQKRCAQSTEFWRDQSKLGRSISEANLNESKKYFAIANKILALTEDER